jgi:hypothetical protein
MAKLELDTNWTKTLGAGDWDIQRRGRGRAYVYRGSSAPSSVDDAMELIEDDEIRRLHVNTLHTAYFYGDGIEIIAYQVVA